MNSIAWLTQSATRPDDHYAGLARARQLQLTKPPGSLGRLEEAAIHLATLQTALRRPTSSSRRAVARVRSPVRRVVRGLAVV